MGTTIAKRATYRVNADSWTRLAEILETRADFNPDSASLRGRAFEIGDRGRQGMGRLPDGDIASEYAVASRDERIDYVIFSYRTPIAWHYRDANEWRMPDTRYSVTTSKHQSKVRTAIGSLTR